MGVGGSNLQTGTDYLKAAIWSGAALVLSSIGIWTGSTLNDLADNVHDLELTLAKLEQRLDALPPPDLLLRVQQLEDWIEREERYQRDFGHKGNAK